MEDPHRLQRVFRVLMQAMANPGKAFPVATSGDSPLLYEICDTLFDHEVSLAATGDGIDGQMIEDICFFSGCRCVSIENADYVIVFGGCSQGALLNVSVGTLERPHGGATIFYPVAGFNGKQGVNLTLRGPGINGRVKVTIDGVRSEELALASRINSRFPLGVDLIFCDAASVMTIPRSATLTFSAKEG